MASAAPVSITVDDTHRVSGLLDAPSGARACYVLAHGASACYCEQTRRARDRHLRFLEDVRGCRNAKPTPQETSIPHLQAEINLSTVNRLMPDQVVAEAIDLQAQWPNAGTDKKTRSPKRSLRNHDHEKRSGDSTVLHSLQERSGKWMAEGEGFEPPVGLPLRLISSGFFIFSLFTETFQGVTRHAKRTVNTRLKFTYF